CMAPRLSTPIYPPLADKTRLCQQPRPSAIIGARRFPPPSPSRVPPMSFSESDTISAPITRREALRRTVIFSAGALLASRQAFAKRTLPTTKFEGQGIHLLAFGDYGAKGNESQTTVAARMSNFAKSLDQPLAAVLALGDNFYKPITPDRFVNHFEKMYSTDALNCPFY